MENKTLEHLDFILNFLYTDKEYKGISNSDIVFNKFEGFYKNIESVDFNKLIEKLKNDKYISYNKELFSDTILNGINLSETEDKLFTITIKGKSLIQEGGYKKQQLKLESKLKVKKRLSLITLLIAFCILIVGILSLIHSW